jgi:hypothetical protein
MGWKILLGEIALECTRVFDDDLLREREIGIVRHAPRRGACGEPSRQGDREPLLRLVGARGVGLAGFGLS